jgi:hypothetical protein
MKKILSTLSSALLVFAALLSFNNVAKSAEFFYDRHRWTNRGLLPNW